MDARSDAARDLDEFGQDPGFQRRFWKAERVAWAFYVLLIILALVGLTGGGGPLAHVKAETPYGVVEYPRVSRWQGADHLTLHLTRGGSVPVELGRGFVDAFEIESITPEPASASVTPDGMRYGFDVQRGGVVVFHLRARSPAFFPDASVRIADAETKMRPLILP